jgi:hypothetical protein
MATARSASIPTMVWPSAATNSSGAYEASTATTRPADLYFAGTFAASDESRDAVGIAVPVPPEFGLLLLHPAAATAVSSRKAPTPHRPTVERNILIRTS